MSTLLENRVQSARSRTIRRPSTNIRAADVIQRSITSMGTHTDVPQLPAWRRLSSTPLGTMNSFQRPKTGSISSSNGPRLSLGTLRTNEITSLLRSLDRDETFVVQVDCLANYRKLVQTINLRQTPVDSKSLCALQQRENRIVQRNACRDTRFRSLLDALEPQHVIKKEEKEPNDVNQKNNSEYQYSDDDDHEYE